jgi:DTW domain-containing protein YfiP
MKIYLLTHSREPTRGTNTGQLVTLVLGERARVIIWDRVNPDPDLLHLIESQSVSLLFPEPSVNVMDATGTATANNVLKTPDAFPEALPMTSNQSRSNKAMSNQARPSGYIILDATWQEARKMYNRSPYLHSLVKCQFTPARPSSYVMRRNQLAEGLCTAECVSELLRLHNEPELAQTLDLALSEFQLLPRDKSKKAL